MLACLRAAAMAYNNEIDILICSISITSMKQKFVTYSSTESTCSI